MTKYRLKPSEIMQDLLDAGAIRPECVEEFKARIAAACKEETSTTKPVEVAVAAPVMALAA